MTTLSRGNSSQFDFLYFSHSALNPAPSSGDWFSLSEETLTNLENSTINPDNGNVDTAFKDIRDVLDEISYNNYEDMSDTVLNPHVSHSILESIIQYHDMLIHILKLYSTSNRKDEMDVASSNYEENNYYLHYIYSLKDAFPKNNASVVNSNTLTLNAFMTNTEDIFSNNALHKFNSSRFNKDDIKDQLEMNLRDKILDYINNSYFDKYNGASQKDVFSINYVHTEKPYRLQSFNIQGYGETIDVKAYNYDMNDEHLGAIYMPMSPYFHNFFKVNRTDVQYCTFWYKQTEDFVYDVPFVKSDNLSFLFSECNFIKNVWSFCKIKIGQSTGVSDQLFIYTNSNTPLEIDLSNIYCADSQFSGYQEIELFPYYGYITDIREHSHEIPFFYCRYFQPLNVYSLFHDNDVQPFMTIYNDSTDVSGHNRDYDIPHSRNLFKTSYLYSGNYNYEQFDSFIYNNELWSTRYENNDADPIEYAVSVFTAIPIVNHSYGQTILEDNNFEIKFFNTDQFDIAKLEVTCYRGNSHDISFSSQRKLFEGTPHERTFAAEEYDISANKLIHIVLNSRYDHDADQIVTSVYVNGILRVTRHESNTSIDSISNTTKLYSSYVSEVRFYDVSLNSTIIEQMCQGGKIRKYYRWGSAYNVQVHAYSSSSSLQHSLYTPDSGFSSVSSPFIGYSIDSNNKTTGEKFENTYMDNDFTLSLWFKIDAFPSGKKQQIISQFDSTTDGFIIFVMKVSGFPVFIINFYKESILYYFHSDVEINTYHHIGIIRYNKETKFFFNGSHLQLEEKTGYSLTPPVQSSRNLEISKRTYEGRYNSSKITFEEGTNLDELYLTDLRIYNKAVPDYIMQNILSYDKLNMRINGTGYVDTNAIDVINQMFVIFNEKESDHIVASAYYTYWGRYKAIEQMFADASKLFEDVKNKFDSLMPAIY